MSNSTNKKYEHFRQQAEQIFLLEKTICELREALKPFSVKNHVSHQPIDCLNVDSVLSLIPSEISAKWVKREVLEKLLAVAEIDANLSCDSEKRKEFREALTLARTELGKEEK